MKGCLSFIIKTVIAVLVFFGLLHLGVIDFIKDKISKEKIKNASKIAQASEFIDKYQRVEFAKDRVVDKRVFDERIEMLNSMFRFREQTIENTQFFNWMITSVFYDIAELRAENISLYRKSDKGIELSKLLVLYEEDNSPYYYLYSDYRL